MTRQKVTTIVGAVLLVVCAAAPVLAQSQTADGAQRSGQEQSAAAMAQEASNPFAASWLMQFQQNNNWTEMPADDQTRLQNNLTFQPLLSLRLTDKRR